VTRPRRLPRLPWRLAVVALAWGALAWGAAQPDLSPRALEPEELDAGTVQRIAFRFELDSIAFPLLERSQVPGLVVSIAYAGEVVAAEAYGSADLAAARTLTLDDPLWLASVTKVLTATIVHDLVAEGVVRLDDPLERWLPFLDVPPAPDGAATPVTIRHLLTHTAGFDVRLLGTLLPHARTDPRLTDLVAAGLPPRVDPPGQRLSYCNLCYALLGMVIEAATGLAVEEAFAERLFEPLSLPSGRILRWGDPAHDAATARPHARSAAGIRVLEMPTLADPPAGGSRLSGHDVGRLLAAFTAAAPPSPLDRGVREALLTPAYRVRPEMPGRTLGMAEAHILGHEVVVHDGDLPGARSLLVIVPQAALAIFVHVNGESDPLRLVPTADGMHEVRWALAEGLIALLLGDAREPPTPTAAVLAGGSVQAPEAGPYRVDFVARTGPEKLLLGTGLLQAPLDVEADGSLVLRAPEGLSTPRRYVPVGPGLFERDHGGERLATTWDVAGRPLVHMSLGGPTTLELVPPLERLSVVAWSVGAFVLLALVVLVSWPLGAYGRWRRRSPRADDAPTPVASVRWAARAVAVTGLTSLALVAAMLAQTLSTLTLAPILLNATGLALVLTAIATMGVAMLTIFGAASGTGRASTWAFHALVTLSAAVLLLQAVVWNLTPWS
jgi:CubicO group peptidase (beta-lactamase class C family)